MRLLLLAAAIWSLCCLHVASASKSKRDHNRFNYYVLEHDPSHGPSAHKCAEKLGAELLEQVGELQDHWVIRAAKPELVSREAGVGDAVLERFRAVRSPYASVLHKRDESMRRAIKGVTLQTLRKRVKRGPVPQLPDGEKDGKQSARAVAERLGIRDPLFPDQWHLVNDEHPEHMMNVTPVWDMGITGHGVISAMVDDGLDYESDDLKDNFDVYGSYDFNDHEDLPTPKLSDDHHGTRCAGQIAAVKNGVCGVGIAYGSKVAGVRILSGEITDVDEAAALNYGYQNTSLYSCSWGPADDGESMAAPGYLVDKAILNGVQNGRQGKGSIFVFASGNGAYAGDQCNFDGYTNSIYSVTVGAIDYAGNHPYYSEPCAANMIVTYSSGANPRKSIVTTDVGKDECSTSHGGTSAAAPNAVGVFALALSVRPDLTWRDIQYLCVNTARVVNPSDPEWEYTANGRLYNYKYGFGKLDAYDFVTAAKDWQVVKPQAWLELPAIQLGNGTMDVEGRMEGGDPIVSGGVASSLVITEKLLKEANFENLEHVTVTVWISHTVRGHVEVELVSPNGNRSVLAKKRSRDRDPNGFMGWKFMTVKHWNENPTGTWSIRVSDQEHENEHGNFLGWSMTLWGSSIDPDKAKPYVLVDTDELPFPPPSPTPDSSATLPTVTSSVESPTPSATTSHEKPDHAVSTSAIAETTLSTTDVPSFAPQPPNWVSDGIEFTSNHSWTLGLIGIVLTLAIAGVSVYLIRRTRQRRREAQYTRVSDGTSEDMRMASTGGSGAGGSVLYDADEEMALTGNGEHGSLYRNAVGFNSGFLDDESPRPSTDKREGVSPTPDQGEQKVKLNDLDSSTQ